MRLSIAAGTHTFRCSPQCAFRACTFMWANPKEMQVNIFGVASLHNRSHLSILFVCHIPFILGFFLEKKTRKKSAQIPKKKWSVFISKVFISSCKRTNQTINLRKFYKEIHTHLLIHLIWSHRSHPLKMVKSFTLRNKTAFVCDFVCERLHSFLFFYFVNPV